ncbi:MAG: hypothetical protein Q9208_001173 [Pyrenodesmia sp. 3 TL-2023]
MVGPETPTKKDDPIERITAELSAKWGLRFPPPIFQSPAQRDRRRPEEQALGRLRYLYFHDKKKNQAATRYAIDGFERLAPKLLAGWIAKPWADEDVLPTRTRSGTARHQEFLAKKPTLTDEQASDLMQAFLRQLIEAKEGIDKGAVFPIKEEPQEISYVLDPKIQGQIRRAEDAEHYYTTNDETPKNRPTRRSSRQSSSKTIRKVTSPLKNGDIKAFLDKAGKETLSSSELRTTKIHTLSSDDYKEDDSLFDDVEMHDITNVADPLEPLVRDMGHVPAAAVGAHGSNESIEENYHTPPESPQKKRDDPSKPSWGQQSWSPKKTSDQGGGSRGSSDTVVPQGKKRSLPAPSKPEISRKVSRDATERRFTGAGPTQHVGGLRYIGDAEFNKATLEQHRSFGSLPKSQSTESFSSVTSSEVTKPLSAFTSHNTSFVIETPATSFDSSQEPFELDPFREKPLHTRRSWQNLKAPFGGLGIQMEVDFDMRDGSDVTPMGPPAPIAKFRSLRGVSVKDLLLRSPFGTANPSLTHAIPLRQLYELCRVSIQNKIPLDDFGACLNQSVDEYEDLWLSMAAVAQTNQASMPERSSLAAWKQSAQDFQEVTLTGSLSFVEQPGDQVFNFRLHPLKMEQTYRLARRFGNDRFFVLSFPSIDQKDLPFHLARDPQARDAIVDWLVNSEHSFLGRKWRAFYVKAESNRKAGSKPGYRIYFFAESGHDFQTKRRTGGEQDPRMFDHLPMTRRNIIDWFMPAMQNKNQRALKFFTRLALGVSQTSSTVAFEPNQIIRSDDAFADAPTKRHLDVKRSNEKKTKRKPKKSKAPVMNDGCARISRRAAKAVADTLNLDRTPSIFQGRIAGAKGVWMVDSLDEVIKGPDGDFWIEITDSQLKFEGRDEDELYPDPERVTFEVSSYARPLVQANLNFQLMPILADRGVPFEVFRDLLEADLTAKVSDLESAMDSGLAIRKWNQDVNPVLAGRMAHGVEMRGGIPSSLSETINWFVEHGFEPRECCRLKDLLYKSIADYCSRLENRMNIGVAKSTYAFMIADPLAVLDEGEVHIGFSVPFDYEPMLHDIDLLVARLPAALPSDVQKIRAVYKLELKAYRDVIVFPSKGSHSLASVLSGGDYDGDLAWICWEPSIVDPFENAPLPSNLPSLADYGIETDITTVSDLLNTHKDPESYTSAFLRHAFLFNLQSNMLGICTSYFEAFCYARNSISHPSAIKIASLLGHLVDRAKAGIVFDDSTWNAFLRREGLPKVLPKPAYRDKEKTPYDRKKGHLIDRLVFETAKGVRQRVLHDFSKKFKDVGSYDVELVALYKNEVVEAKSDGGIAQALKGLRGELDKLRDVWSALCSSRIGEEDGDELSPVKKERRKSGMGVLSFQALCEQVRDRFLALRPSEEAIAKSPVVARWEREAFPQVAAATSFSSTTSNTASVPPPTIPHWTLLKASYAFYLFHNRTFVWYACGVELGILKSQARSCSNVVTPIWECMKLDGKAVARRLGGDGDEIGLSGRGPGEGGIGDGEPEGEADEYGDWGWVEEVDV